MKQGRKDIAMASTELTCIKGSSWVIPGPTNIGWIEKNGGVYLIDSGNDKEAGRKINKLLSERGLVLSGILNTHSNADHIGGNDYLQRMTGCRIYATRAEKAFIESPPIEGGFLWGGFTVKALKNKFFEAKASTVTDILEEDQITAEDIHVVGLPGHFFQMAGFITADKVAYLGDAMVGEQILEKYKIPYIYDVEQYKLTIDKIKQLDAGFFVLSHGNVEEDITSLADRNLDKVYEVEGLILEAASKKATFEEILQETCGKLGVCLEIAQYALIGNTVRSFLSYLSNQHKVRYEFIDNKMYWEKT